MSSIVTPDFPSRRRRGSLSTTGGLGTGRLGDGTLKRTLGVEEGEGPKSVLTVTTVVLQFTLRGRQALTPDSGFRVVSLVIQGVEDPRPSGTSTRSS